MTCPSRKAMSMFRGREDIHISGKDSGHLARALVDIRESSHTNGRAFGCTSRVVGIPEKTDIHQRFGQMPGILAR